MDEKVNGEAGVTAEQARKISESSRTRVNRELYQYACRKIRSAARCNQTSCQMAVEYGYEAQDQLVKRLTEDGFKVKWVTDSGPRTDDCAIINVSWRK